MESERYTVGSCFADLVQADPLAATTLLLAGVPVHVVASQAQPCGSLDHAARYAHVISDQLTEAADIFALAVAATSQDPRCWQPSWQRAPSMIGRGF